MLTQDAIPVADDSIRHLLAAFDDPDIALAYGRQLPRPGARAIETHARLFNYGGEDEKRGIADRARFGVKTVFCSDSYAAYRRIALEQVGGFPEDAFFAEDQIVAGRMLLAGWHLAYRAGAEAYHSHSYSIVEDFRRYFDVGAFHARNTWLLDSFGRAEGEGMRFILSEMRYLARREPLSIPSAFIRTFAK